MSGPIMNRKKQSHIAAELTVRFGRYCKQGYIQPGDDVERYYQVYSDMSDDERDQIEMVIQCFEDGVSRLGTISALELVGKLGEFFVENGIRSVPK